MPTLLDKTELVKVMTFDTNRAQNPAMDQAEQHNSRRSPVERLSVELILMVLSALPDILSLQASVLSCPLFYHVFLRADARITTEVLSHQIDSSVLPEAVAALQSSELRPHDTEAGHRKAIIDCVSQTLRQRPAPPRSWPLRRALHLGRLHVTVDWFATRFATVALARSPHHRSELSTSIATSQEKRRIERALYRFQIYCNVFGDMQNVPSAVFDDLNSFFFAKFAPWENEQLGCVHDLLVEAVAPAFNDIVEHDVVWGVFNISYITRVGSPFIQHVLSLGLRKLYQIVTSENYEDRLNLLHSGDYPDSTEYFLYDGLQCANEDNYDIDVKDLTSENESVYVKQASFADPDPGPSDAWRWGYREESWHGWVYQEDRHAVRQWAYVMWDRSRLEAMGILREPWDVTCHPEDLLFWRCEETQQQSYLQNSWEQREQVYKRGGTGWWSWGDDSKVRWREGVIVSEQGPSVPKHVQPGSLQEAREMLRIMRLPPFL